MANSTIKNGKRKQKEVQIVETDDKKPTTGRGGKNNFPAAQMKTIETDEDKRAVMAKITRNNLEFFKMGTENPVDSNEKLCERINQFFETCAATQQLPTVEKLALAIGVVAQTLRDWEHRKEGAYSKSYWVTEETSLIIKKAKQMIASMDAELALEGKIQAIVYIFRAKNFYGMKDQQDLVVTPNTGADIDAEKLVEDSKMLPLNKSDDE